jgi:hypothetical protein
MKNTMVYSSKRLYLIPPPFKQEELRMDFYQQDLVHIEKKKRKVSIMRIMIIYLFK